ncbi:MAG: carbohydrate-binding domain-containing protein [Clostridia bacterium]|nr:carbohydrate-binding domain-containing protein [Clostridia bacterium]MBQ5956571.1 carbohydrate-binding domain-containing protein [Clostridia bacterium]
MKKSISIMAVIMIMALIMCSCANVSGVSSSEEAEVISYTSSQEGTSQVSEIMDLSAYDLSLSDRDLETETDVSGATVIEISGDSVNIDGSGATYKGNILYISSAGIYSIYGSSDNISIYIKAGDDDKVQLVLNGVNLKSSNGPVIASVSADKVFITLAEGTVNYLEDSASYSGLSDDGFDAAVFCRTDLTVNGTGTLYVTGNYKHGIVCKDDLVLTNVKLTISSIKTGITGKDSVKIKNAVITIYAGTDGIRSDNDEEDHKGYIMIEGASVSIEPQDDGIQAEDLIMINSSDITIKGGSSSDKGIKSEASIIIYSGDVSIDTEDDAINATESVQIFGGKTTLSTKDDGIHADGSLIITGGTVIVEDSYEGLEAETISIYGGEISVYAEDDGINACGGNDGSGTGNMFMDSFQNTTGSITIAGGTVYVNAKGDGIDSNGSIYISGGTITVDGPANNGNGALDYNTTATITGGTFIATGSSGMVQSMSSAENQGVILCTFDGLSAGTTIILQDGKGNIVAEVTPTKTYSSIVISSPEITEGNTYVLKTGDTVLSTIIMTSLLYGSGSMNMGGGFNHHP